jgi:hypothetical protein
MNEILLHRHSNRYSRKAMLKHLVWAAAKPCQLSGLFPWQFEDHWIRVQEMEMPLLDLGEPWQGATLAHISDLHSSPIVLQRYLRQCVQRINDLGVDFVAITGDFITGYRRYARRVSEILSHLQPKVATVACLGNHDYGSVTPRGLGHVSSLGEYLTEKLTHADIFVMLNEPRTFWRDGQPLQFVGLEDLWSPGYDPQLAFELSRPGPTITLVHNPDAVHDLTPFGPQWILAGHTHGNPHHRPSRISNLFRQMRTEEFYAGHYPLGDHRHLYINRGLSYGRRHNLNAQPEITLFTLRQGQPADRTSDSLAISR